MSSTKPEAGSADTSQCPATSTTGDPSAKTANATATDTVATASVNATTTAAATKDAGAKQSTTVEPAAADGKPPPPTASANCYCAKERSVGTVELLCATCNKWFHERCITVPLGKLIPFASNYVFFCKACTPSGVESFRRCQASECAL